MKKAIYSSFVLFSLCGALNTVHAVDIYTAENVPGGRLNLYFRGFVDQTYIGAQGTLASTVTASFDWAAATASIQNFELMFSGATYTLTRSYTTGPGQVKTITASVNIDPFTISAVSLPQYQLTPAANGRYDMHQQTGGAWGSLPLSGNVLIQGPTQSASVPFSLAMPVDANIRFPFVNSVETADYPGSLSLNVFETSYDGGGELLGAWFVPDVGEPWRLAEATIDGIDVDISTISGMAATYGTFSMHAVPEPGVGLLLLLGVGSWLTWRRARG